MSSIQDQFPDLGAHHAVYEAIDPKSGLKDSASGKVVFIAGASRGIGQATAVAFAEAKQPSFAQYAQRIVDNAAALGEGLKRRGARLVTDGTTSHPHTT